MNKKPSSEPQHPEPIPPSDPENDEATVEQLEEYCNSLETMLKKVTKEQETNP
ncbi:MAG: hypothetical protein V4651_13695 [Bacteroidota bacterium]